MAMNDMNSTDVKLAWADDTIKCDFDSSTFGGFDDWKLYQSADDLSP